MLAEMLKSPVPLPPFTEWTMEEEAMRIISADLMRNPPHAVLELGSGLSTMAMACLGETYQFTVEALEHDRTYYQSTRDYLRKLGPMPGGVYLCPLTNYFVPWCENRRVAVRWYDIAHLPVRQFDFLLVDGPPSFIGQYARYPAIPLLWDRLAPGCRIFVDDGNRPEDNESIETWKTIYRVEEVKRYDTERGLVELRVPAFHVKQEVQNAHPKRSWQAGED
jgi:hypothetical protein